MIIGSKVTKAKDIAPILELVKKTGRSLLLFSTDLQMDPMSNMLYHAKKKLVTCCAVNIPWQAGEEIEMLKDIAILTGAIFIDNSMMKSITKVNLNSLGTCTHANILMNQTRLIGARGNPKEINERISQLKEILRIDKTISFSRKKIINSRISRLSGLVGTLYIGGETETIRNETRDKLIDALNGCKAAIEKGVLPGGGVALLHASKIVENTIKLKNIDQRQGARIVLNAVKMPMRIILRNAGLNESIIMNKVIESGSPWIGYNVRERK